MDIDGRCYNRPCVDVHATERMVDVVDIAITINTGVDIWCVTEALRTMMPTNCICVCDGLHVLALSSWCACEVSFIPREHGRASKCILFSHIVGFWMHQHAIAPGHIVKAWYGVLRALLGQLVFPRNTTAVTKSPAGLITAVIIEALV